MHEDAVFLEKVLAAGGNGFVLKRAADEELLAAIKAVHRGEVYIDTSLQRYLVTKALNPESQVKNRVAVELTAREKEILQLVALLEITSRSKLVRYAMEQGLI